MLRRSFVAVLSALATHPVINARLDSDYSGSVPDEGSMMFWYHFYATVQRDNAMSTTGAREQTIDGLELQDLTDDEAIRILKLASDGAYDTDDMPERWSGVFEQMQRDL